MSSGSVPSGTRCATRAIPLMSSAAAAIWPADSSSRAARSRCSSRSASLSLVTTAEIRSGSCSRGVLNCSLSWLTSVLSRARKRNASMPTSASIRRTPEPMDDSPSTLIRPSWPDLATCVPPHSSREYSPTSTTRTWSPYFSPNSASAPIWRASSWEV